MSKESAVSAIERGALSELCHVLKESEWDIRSETLDSKGQSALHITCTRGHLDIVQYLVIEKKCSVTVEDVYGQTPLLLSLINNHWKIADFLLQNTKMNEELRRAQMFYSETSVIKVAKKTLHDRPSYFELTRFIHAIAEIENARSSGNLYHFQYLLKAVKCIVPEYMPDIHVACIVGDMEKVKSALDSNGQSILGTSDHYGITVIHYAAYEPNVLNMIVGKINNGQVLNYSDKRGNTVLHHCVMSGCIESVEHVVGVPECNVNQLNDEGDAPLHVACNLRKTGAVQLLVADERCDINIHNQKGDAALHIAAYIESKSIEMVKCLLRNGKCDLNQVNSEHETPLHVACKHGHVRVVEMLVADERCDPFIQDINGDTALYAAVGTNPEAHKDMIVQFLLCRCDLTDKEGMRCTNELDLNFVFSGIAAMLEMSDYHVIIQGGNDKRITLRKGASLNTFKMLLRHIANCNSLCSTSLLLQIPNLLLHEHTDTSYTSYITVNLRVQKKTFPSNEQNKTLVVEYKGIDGCLSYKSDQGTLLHAACRSGYSAMAAALLKYGGDVQALDRDGNTACHIACHNLQFNCLRLLGEHLNQLNADGDTVLHILCGMEISRENLSEFVEFLRETKLDINSFNAKGETPLHVACTWSSGDVVQNLVAMECDVNACDGLGNTALDIAVVSSGIDRLKKVQCLLESDKCNPNVCNKCGLTPLHAACNREGIEVLEMLVTDQRCDVNIQDGNGNTPLHTAIRTHSGLRWRKVQVLLNNSACDLNLVDKDGSTSVHIASEKSDISVLELLVADKRCDINIQDMNGDTALHRGVHSAEIVKCLIEVCQARCDIHNRKGQTPFHKAIVRGILASVEVFLGNGVDIQQSDVYGNAPIHIACQYSRFTILKALLGCKTCDPNQQNADGDTALHIVSRMTLSLETKLHYLQLLLSTPGINPEVVNNEHHTPFDVSNKNGNNVLHNACALGKSEMVQLLIENGADVLRQNKHGNAPIHIACLNFRLDILRILLSCKHCNPNQQNEDRDTALHIVSRMTLSLETKLHYLQLLLSTPGINPEVVNNEHHTPFDVSDKNGNNVLHNACALGKSEMVQLLIENGADVLIQNKHGNAPIHIACLNFRLDILRILLSCKHCNPNQQNEDRDTALHIVCRMRIENELEYLKSLLSAPGVDIQQSDRNENAPIHIACQYSKLDILKAILGCKTCDPNQQNANGDTALHVVSRMTLDPDTKLQYLELLLSKPGINAEVLSNEHLTPFVVSDEDGNTLLHIACAKGKSEMVQLLMENGADVLRQNRRGNAPIHIACLNFRLDILRFLLNCQHCDPNQQNKNGNTALHIVCKMRISNELEYINLLLSTPGVDVQQSDSNGNAPIHIACQHSRFTILKAILGHETCDPNQQNANGDTALHIVCRMRIGNELEYLKLLLSVPGINLNIANHAGLTLIEVAGTNYAIIDALEKILMPKMSSVQAYLKLFVVGNSGTGKSTLIKAVTTEASQLLKYSPFSRMKYVNPRDVPPHTAGIVPIPFNSKHFGNAVLYDFAGQHEYYSSHAAVMENLILPSPPLFLLLVDISKPMEEIKEELHYWWHFIDNQSQKATAHPHVLLGGSHKDIVKQRGRHQLHTIRMEIETCVRDIKVSFTFAGLFLLDCRRLASQGLIKLLTQLQTSCKVLREAVDINLHCHILKAFLTTPVFQDEVYCKVIDIVDQIETSDSYLPQSSLALIPLLQALNDQGHILLLENHTDEDQSWVILKPEVLLTDINGSIFAPEYFQKRSNHFAMSTGVGTLSKLKENFTNYNHEVIVEYLIHHEFCFRIKDQHILDMITNNQAPRTLAEQFTEEQQQEKYYFFPALVSVENPQHICQPHESITFECGWYYVCVQETEQLTTRFLHVLILRLAFACEPTDNPTEAKSVVLLRRCSVWKHGIAWLNNDGIETIVEVGLQCRWVTVMMRCPDNEKVQCAELRTKVIKTVQNTRKDFCPAITMMEYLIHPSNLQYPFEGRELTLYSMREIAKVIVDGKAKAVDTMGKNLINIPELLPFEPYLCMHHLIEKFFVGDTSLPVTADDMELLEIKCRNMLTELKKAFKQDIRAFQRDCAGAECTEVESCNTLFHILQRRGFKTWRHFEEGFSRFSIFCGRNPMVRTVRQIQ